MTLTYKHCVDGRILHLPPSFHDENLVHCMHTVIHVCTVWFHDTGVEDVGCWGQPPQGRRPSFDSLIAALRLSKIAILSCPGC